MKQGYVMALGYGELTEKRLVSKVIQISCLGHSPLSPFIICYCLLFYLLLYFFLLFFKNPVVIVFMCRAPTSLNCVVSEIYHSSFCKTSLVCLDKQDLLKWYILTWERWKCPKFYNVYLCKHQLYVCTFNWHTAYWCLSFMHLYWLTCAGLRIQVIRGVGGCWLYAAADKLATKAFLTAWNRQFSSHFFFHYLTISLLSGYLWQAYAGLLLPEEVPWWPTAEETMFHIYLLIMFLVIQSSFVMQLVAVGFFFCISICRA